MNISAEERREEIVKAVQSRGKVRVSELSRRFSVTEVSIRNDLDILAEEGYLTRTHGGATAPQTAYDNMNKNERYLSNSAAKEALARRVASLIDDNDTIMMNAGTTLLYVLRALRHKKNLSIVTNSLQSAAEAASFSGFNVILLGGQLDGKYHFTFGQDTVHQLEGYHANKCILSVDGICPAYGLSLYYPNETNVILKMMEMSKSVIVAADSTKLLKSTFSRVAPLSSISALVTNAGVDRQTIAPFTEAGISVYEA